MIIEETVILGEEEFREAILDYVNKHKNSDYSEMKGLLFTNGTQEEEGCFSGLKFKVV